MTMKDVFVKLKHFFAMMREDYPYVWLIIIVNMLSAGTLPFLNLFLYARILNQLLAGEYRAAVVSVAILILGSFILEILQTITDSRINLYYSTLNNSISRQINDKAYVMEYDNYEKQDSMDKIRTAREKANGAGGAGEVLLKTRDLFLAVYSALLCAGMTAYLFISLRHVIRITDISLWILPVLLLLILFAGSRVSSLSMSAYEAMQKKNVRSNSMAGYLMSAGMSPENKKDIMLYGFKSVFNSYVEKVLSQFDNFLIWGRTNGFLTAILVILMYLFAAAAYIFVGLQAYQGNIAIGDVLMYAGAIQMLTGKMKDITVAWNAVAFRLDFVDDFYKFINAPAMHYEGTLPVEKRSDNNYEIEFRDVSFCYPGSERLVLDHVNLKCKVGEKIAMVGRNGAGKTTMVRLLCRLYEPTKGQILLNGIDIWKYDYREYTRIFAPVFQNFAILSLSIAENVAFEKNADENKIWNALQRVGLKERMDRMPEGIHTLLNHDNGEGVDVSGGEAQKIAIARALYKDAPFVILDEPTAALDPMAEAEIYENFNDLVQDKTSIYISHRMSSCRFCDRIVVFQNGRITEEGTHEELLDKNGEYAALFHAQAEYYRESALA